MGILKIYLFGKFQIYHDNCQVEIKLTRSVQLLLAFLLIHRDHIHSREIISDVFWEDSSSKRAQNRLGTTLWRLRKALEPFGVNKGTYVLSDPSGGIGFNLLSDYWLDVAVFEDRVKAIISKPINVMERKDALHLEDAIKLYRGDLLEMFYDDWVIRERERLHSLYLKSLIHLMRYKRHQGDYDESEALGHHILDQDPMREDIHRDLMLLYLARGQRAMALRQYKICCKMLEDELGICPDEATQSLYAEIINGGNNSWDRQLAQNFSINASLTRNGDDEAVLRLGAIIQMLQAIIEALRKINHS